MSYEQLATSVDALAVANRVLTEAVNATQVDIEAAVQEAEGSATAAAASAELAAGKVGELAAQLLDPEEGGNIVTLTTGETVSQRTENVIRRKRVAREVDIIVGYGQSNMRGYANNSPGAPEYVTPNVTVWNGTSEIPLTSYTPTQNDGVSTGSLFAAFGNEYAAKTSRKAIMANCARGSQSIAALSKGASNTNYSGLVSWVSAIKSHIIAEGNTIGRISVIWLQGETDSVIGTTVTSQSYYDSISTLWSNLQSDTGATALGIFTVGFYADDSKRNGQAIQFAQRRFANDNPNVYIIFDDMESMGFMGMKVDSVHLNQYGYNYIGKKGAASFCDAVYIDGHTEADKIADRLGVISLDGSQSWTYFGGWFNRPTSTGAWNLTTTGSRGLTGVIKVEELDAYSLRVTLATRVDYILKEHAQCLLSIAATREPIRAVISPMTYQNVDANGNTFVDIRFYADVNYLLDLTAKTLTPQTTNGITSAVGNALITNTVWGTGGVTITHSGGGVMPIVTPNSASNTPTLVNVVGPTPMNIRLFDTTGTPLNGTAWVTFNGAAIPLVALGTPEVRLEILAARRHSS